MYEAFSMRSMANKASAIGTCAVLAFGGLTVKLFVFPAVPYTVRDLVVIQGVLERAEEVNIRQGSSTLQLWLQDTELPFRSSGPIPAEYNRGALAGLRPGFAVTISSPSAEEVAPRRDRLQGQEFRRICA